MHGTTTDRFKNITAVRKAVDFQVFEGLSKLLILYWGMLKPTSDSHKILVWSRCACYPIGLLIPVLKSGVFITRFKYTSLTDSNLL